MFLKVVNLNVDFILIQCHSISWLFLMGKQGIILLNEEQ